MERISNYIPFLFLFFLFQCSFQQSFNVFSGRQGKISSIVLSDGNIVVFVNDLKNEKYQEYAQKLNAEGALSASNVAIYQGTSSSTASRFLTDPAGGFFVLFQLDAADRYGYFSYLAKYQNDLTTKILSTNFYPSLILERHVCFLLKDSYVVANSPIPTSTSDIFLNFYQISDLVYKDYKPLRFSSKITLTDINSINLKNGKTLVVISILDSTYNSYYLSVKAVSFQNFGGENFDSGNFNIDSSSPANGINHLYSQFAIESSSENIIIVYQSTGETLSSNSAVKYAVLDPAGSSTFKKTASFLTDSDSSNIKYPKLLCLNNGKCIISWIDVDEKICFQIINNDGTLSGSKVIGPKIEQPINSKSGSFIQIPNSNDFMYFHSMTTTANVVGWKFNSDCQLIYTTETCKGVLSADRLTCTPIDNCLIYKSDRSACSECIIGFDIDSNNLCVKQAIIYCKTYTDNAKTICSTCDSNHFRSETGIICAEPIKGCSIYSDSRGICKECDPGKVQLNGGFICADPKYPSQMERGKCVECLFPGDRPNMNAFIHTHYYH